MELKLPVGGVEEFSRNVMEGVRGLEIVGWDGLRVMEGNTVRVERLELTGRGLRGFGGNRFLGLQRVEVGEMGLEEFEMRGEEELREIRVGRNRVRRMWLEGNGGLERVVVEGEGLEEMRMVGGNVGEFPGEGFVAGNLRRLTLGGRNLTRCTLMPSFPKLEHLDIEDTMITDLTPFPPLLTSLTLSNTQLTILSSQTLPSLTTLTLANNSLLH